MKQPNKYLVQVSIFFSCSNLHGPQFLLLNLPPSIIPGPNDRAGAHDAALGQRTSGRVGRGGRTSGLSGKTPGKTPGRRAEILATLGVMVVFHGISPTKSDDFLRVWHDLTDWVSGGIDDSNHLIGFFTIKLFGDIQVDTTDKEWVMEDLLRDDTTQSIGDSQKMSQSVVGNPFLTSRTENKKNCWYLICF